MFAAKIEIVATSIDLILSELEEIKRDIELHRDRANWANYQIDISSEFDCLPLDQFTAFEYEGIETIRQSGGLTEFPICAIFIK